MFDLRGQSGRRKTGSRRRVAAGLGLAVAVALIPTFASAHVERSSYWPDPGADMVDGVPTGGAVPEIRPLETALDDSQPGDTFVVCVGGQAVTAPTPPSRRADQNVTKARQDVEVSKAEMDRLKAKLRKLHSEGNRTAARRVKRKLKKAKAAYEAALAAEQAARQAAEQKFQQDTAAEQGARQQADAQYQQQLADYQNALNQYDNDVDNAPSMQALDEALEAEVANGYKLRPSASRITVTQQEADQLRDFNAQLLAQCAYDSIQDAVNASGNNDRIVVMPGTYTEPDTRAVQSHWDPADMNNPCHDLYETNDHGTTGALSYRYQFHCPNQQNLIAIMGREPAKDGNGDEVEPPQPPLEDRRGIPDEGPCIHCNLQIEGSGASPDDVIVDGGDPSLGDHSPPGADQDNYAKDVGIRADRADGFVLTNMKVRHVNEHDIYVTETDGFNLSRFKVAYAGEYGVLTYVADHSLIHNCDAWGHGDSALYPGAAADTWDAVPEAERRRSNEIRDCDMRHSALGYSGTDGNAVWIHDNEFYGNTQGFSTDVFTAPGHPGFPQDSDLIENNNFHDNNFNPYLPGCGTGGHPAVPGPMGPNQDCTDFFATVPVPVGVGLWIAGGNHNIIRNNHFWNNWRRGTMLFSVPDQFVCGPAGVDPSLLAGCNPTAAQPSTSYNNLFHNNTMGQTPGGAADPNGIDFWWDEYQTNTGNCWYQNTGTAGTGASVTTVPQTLHGLPDCGNGMDPSLSIGTGSTEPAPYAADNTDPHNQEQELLACLASFSGAPAPCDWFETPPEP